MVRTETQQLRRQLAEMREANRELWVANERLREQLEHFRREKQRLAREVDYGRTEEASDAMGEPIAALEQYGLDVKILNALEGALDCLLIRDLVCLVAAPGDQLSTAPQVGPEMAGTIRAALDAYLDRRINGRKKARTLTKGA